MKRHLQLLTLIIGCGSLLHAQTNYVTPYKFTTVAGIPPNSPGSSDGTGSGARFNSPLGIATDMIGNLYVADSVNDTIRKIDTNDVVTTIAGQVGVGGSSDGTGTNALFNGPTGIAVDENGNLYVTDTGNETIRKIDTNDVVTTIAGQPGVGGSSNGTGTNATFNYPQGITIDVNGNVYVADTYSSTIRKIDTNDVVTTIAGQPGVQGSSDGKGTNSRFYIPQGVTVDRSGNLYVTDTGNETIRKIDTKDVVTTLAGQAGVAGSSDGAGDSARFNSPFGIAADKTGNLYVADTSNNNIRKINNSDSVTTLAGVAMSHGSSDGPGVSAQFNNPEWLTVDGSGNIYVADTGNSTIRRVDSHDVVTTIAGGGSDFDNGKGTNAAFSSPQGIAVDGSGNLYVLDKGNRTICKIDQNDVVTAIGFSIAVNGISNISEGIAVNRIGSIFVPAQSMISDIYINHAINEHMGSYSHYLIKTLAVKGENFFAPTGIAVDKTGNLYVADRYSSTILKIATNEVVTTIAGQVGVAGSSDGAGTNATFISPNGIAMDKTGNLYVADSYTIRKIDTNGVVTTIAGQLGVAGSSDGTGTNATFNRACGIAVDGSGNMYVADTGNSTIRKGTLSPAKVQKITFGAFPTLIYGSPSLLLTASATSGEMPTFVSSNTNVATISGNTATIVGAGTTTITATVPADSNYLPASLSKVLTVAKAPQTINGFVPFSPLSVGAPAITLPVTSSAAQAVTYTSSNKKVATVTGNTLTILGSGLTTITATVPATANYNAVTIHQVLKVTK